MLKKYSPKLQEIAEQSRNEPSQFWGSQEMYIFCGVIFAIAALFFIWAKYIRKPKRRSRSLTTKMPSQISRSPRDRGEKRRRYRRSRRNPTLAETGGLPPTKDVSDSD